LSSLSVYLQVIPFLIFGKSVFVTRLVSVLIATLEHLRWVYPQGYLQAAILVVWVLLLSIALPGSCTLDGFRNRGDGFFLCVFFIFYLRYRYISPRALYPALIMGAMVFYTYSQSADHRCDGHISVLLDLRYHWQNRKTAIWDCCC